MFEHAQVKYTKIIAEYFQATPLLGEIASLVSAAGMVPYLSGGTVRNLLLGSSRLNDIDLLIEGDPAKQQNLSKAHSAQIVSKGKALGQRIDIKFTQNAKLYVSQYDFTINTPLYNLLTKEFTCSDAALQDLKAKRLRYNTLTLFTANHSAFVRAFRLALTYSLNIDDSLLFAIKTYGPMIGGMPLLQRAECIAELLKLLSNPSLKPVLAELEKSQLFINIFPMLIPSGQLTDSSPYSHVRHFEALSRLEALLDELPAPAKSFFEQRGQGDGMVASPWNLLAIARLACFFVGLGYAYQALDSHLPEHLKSDDFAKHTGEKLLVGLRDEFSKIANLGIIFQGVAAFSMRATSIYQGLQSQDFKSHTSLLSNSDPALLLASVIALTHLQAEPKLISVSERLKGELKSAVWENAKFPSGPTF